MVLIGRIGPPPGARPGALLTLMQVTCTLAPCECLGHCCAEARNLRLYLADDQWTVDTPHPQAWPHLRIGMFSSSLQGLQRPELPTRRHMNSLPPAVRQELKPARAVSVAA